MLSQKFDVVAAGRAYTDIIAYVSGQFFIDHNIPVDGKRECSIDEINEIIKTLLNTKMLSGGPSANTVYTVTTLGGKSGYFGKVQHDAAGEEFLKDLKKSAVTICCVPYAAENNISATCLVLLNGDKRSFAFNAGCSDNFSNDDFESFDFSAANFFLIESYLLKSRIAKKPILNAIEQARSQTSLVVNLQGMMNWSNDTDIVRHIHAQADIVVGNMQEQDAYNCALGFMQLPPNAGQTWIITKGEKGAEIVQCNKDSRHYFSQTPKNFVSSVGAGDGFMAGFLLGQSRGMDVNESMNCAIRVATSILEEEGPRPTRSLDHLMVGDTMDQSMVSGPRLII